LIVAFIDECRAAGHAVESICRVLSEQGCQVAARTYRAWASAGQRVADRTASDAIVVNVGARCRVDRGRGTDLMAGRSSSGSGGACTAAGRWPR
jgi:hypothetical protein